MKLVNSPHNKTIIHFIGIGGIGISGLAETMHNLGYAIQGSDIADNYNTERLRSMGIKIYIGHQKINVIDAKYIVISSAIKNDNPEVQHAIQNKIPVIKRAEMLAELMRFKTSIAISGSHGKTTTTSLIGHIFESAGLNPTVINGGIINSKLTNAYIGSGNFLIAEADESDATFIKVSPTISVVTNIDMEHLDYYGSFENLIRSFKDFIVKIPFYGFSIICIDNPIAYDISQSVTERKIISYGIKNTKANVLAENIRLFPYHSIFNVKITLPSGSIYIENIKLSIPGEHNVLNSLAAIAIAAELNFGIQVIQSGFKDFEGVKRRFTNMGEYDGITIVDDYAHHPEEIKATLKIAKNITFHNKGKVIAVIQPHRYSRVHSLFKEFCECLSDADVVYITDIYPAGEKNTYNITNNSMVDYINQNKLHNNVNTLPSECEVYNKVYKSANNGDMIIMMGAGNITHWASNLVNKLKNI